MTVQTKISEKIELYCLLSLNQVIQNKHVSFQFQGNNNIDLPNRRVSTNNHIPCMAGSKWFSNKSNLLQKWLNLTCVDMELI